MEGHDRGKWKGSAKVQNQNERGYEESTYSDYVLLSLYQFWDGFERGQRAPLVDKESSKGNGDRGSDPRTSPFQNSLLLILTYVPSKSGPASQIHILSSMCWTVLATMTRASLLFRSGVSRDVKGEEDGERREAREESREVKKKVMGEKGN